MPISGCQLSEGLQPGEEGRLGAGGGEDSLSVLSWEPGQLILGNRKYSASLEELN